LHLEGDTSPICWLALTTTTRAPAPACCRSWHCGRVTSVTFSALCRHFKAKGVVDIETKDFTVQLT
jgi:hypothetical protein